MDAYARKHLEDWLTRNTRGAERMVVRSKILKVVKDHPELVDPNRIDENRSWSEIRRMAETSYNPGKRRSRKKARYLKRRGRRVYVPCRRRAKLKTYGPGDALKALGMLGMAAYLFGGAR